MNKQTQPKLPRSSSFSLVHSAAMVACLMASFSDTRAGAQTTVPPVRTDTTQSAGDGSANSAFDGSNDASKMHVPINQLDGARYLDQMIPRGPNFGKDSAALVSVSSAWSPSGTRWQFPWWEPNV